MPKSLRDIIEQRGGIIEIDGLGTIRGIELSIQEADDDSLCWLQDKSASEVRHLSLEGSGATDASLEFLGCLPNLESLYLFNTTITGMGFDGAKTKRLKKLSLVACRELTIDGLSRLATIKSIEKLKLSDSSVDDRGLSSVATLPNLEILWVNNTGISDVGLAALSSASRLGYLCVDNTHATPEGIKRLYESLPSLRQSLIL